MFFRTSMSISGNIHADRAEQESWWRSCFEKSFRIAPFNIRDAAAH
jgi:hypothetical protein